LTRLQAAKLRELERYLAKAKENCLLLNLQIGTGAHTAFFALKPLDKRQAVKLTTRKFILPAGKWAGCTELPVYINVLYRRIHNFSCC